MGFPSKYVLHVYVYMGVHKIKRNSFFFRAGSVREAIKKASHKIDTKLRNSSIDQQVLYRREW